MGKLFKCYHKEFEFTLIPFLIRFCWIFSYEFCHFLPHQNQIWNLLKNLNGTPSLTRTDMNRSSTNFEYFEFISQLTKNLHFQSLHQFPRHQSEYEISYEFVLVLIFLYVR